MPVNNNNNSVIGRVLEGYTSYRFRITVDGITLGAFTECALPSLQVETLDIKEGGQNTFSHKLPVRVNAGSLTLKHGLTSGKQLLDWYLQVLDGDMENAVRDVTITMLDETGATLMNWTFYNAYPIKWGGPQLKADNSAVAIEELELVHHGFEVS